MVYDAVVQLTVTLTSAAATVPLIGAATVHVCDGPLGCVRTVTS